MNLSLERKVAVGFALVVGVIFLVGALQFRAARRSAEENQWVSHTYAVLQELSNIRRLVNRADAAAQNFAITSEASSHETFVRASTKIDTSIASLRRLTSDNPEQQQRLERLDPLLRDALQSLQAEINFRQSGPFDLAKLIPLEQEVRRSVDDLRAALAEMEATEYELLDQRTQAVERSNRHTNQMLFLGGVFALLLAAAAAGALRADIAERRKSELKFGSLLESAPTAMVIYDAQGHVSLTNAQADRLFGYEHRSLLGQSVETLLPEREREDLAGVARYFHLKDLPIGGERFECIGRKRDGAEFPIEVSLSFLDDGGRPCFSAAIRDITEQREREGALRRLSGRLLQIQDDERRRIAREVHDSLGQYLAAAKMHLQALDQERPQSGNARSSGSPGFDSQDRGGPTIQECIEILDKAITEVRTVSYLLYPPMLDEVGLQSAISGYVEGFAKRSGIATDLEIDPDLGRLPREVELSLFRVLQECLTNIHRHSGSQTARVKLATDGANTVLEIRDDGKGMPDGSLEKFHKDLGTTLGVGLRGMSARMHQLGGKLELFSDAKGTAIIATVPAA